MSAFLSRGNAFFVQNRGHKRWQIYIKDLAKLKYSLTSTHICMHNSCGCEFRPFEIHSLFKAPLKTSVANNVSRLKK